MNMREIERKYVLSGVEDLTGARLKLFKVLHNLVVAELIFEGVDHDTYYAPPEYARAKFIRVRQNTLAAFYELTVKSNDKGTNVDRKEINLFPRKDEPVAEFCEELFGSPLGTVSKSYVKFKLSFAEVAAYQVDGDARIFVEIEAGNLALVGAIETMLREGNLQLTEEPRSVFEIFVTKGNK